MKYLADSMIWVSAVASVLVIAALLFSLNGETSVPPHHNYMLSGAMGIEVIVASPFVMGLLIHRYLVASYTREGGTNGDLDERLHRKLTT